MTRQTKIRILAGTAGFILIAVTVSAFVAKGAKARKDKDKDDKAETVFAVSTTTATKGELKDYLEFGGDVAAKSNVDVLPDAAGKVAEVKVRVGDEVAKNQVIATVDASRPGMNYALSPVKAPISGTVTAVNVVAGSMVSQQVPVAKVGKIETLEVSMNVPERYVSKIKKGQSAMLRFDAYPGEVFLATITEVSPVLDQSSRTMAVKLTPTRQDPRVRAGMFARVKLITDVRTGTVKVPAAAVVKRFDEEYVFAVVAGEEGKTTVSRRKVKPGIRVDDKIEILEGLAAGEEIVVRGQTLLEDASTVNVVSRLEPLPEMESMK